MTIGSSSPHNNLNFHHKFSFLLSKLQVAQHMLNMDAILEICFSENLFKMPKRKSKDGTSKRDIPSNNPYKYCSTVEPILETHVTKEGLISLPCRATHKVSPHSVKIKENDALYDIYTRCMNRSISFVREWLKVFVLMHKVQLAKKAKQYLKLKGLSIDMWSESITDGHKGDVLVLFGLNLLTETHCVVHLANGQIWTTLATLSGVHSTDLQKCDLHLPYIGRGLFIELTEHAVPLMITQTTASTTSLVIGELSAIEECIIEDVMKTGLGVGLTHATSQEPHTA